MCSLLYDATRVTDEDLSLNIEDFGAQVLAPQIAAVAAGAENQLAAVMNDLGVDLPCDLDTVAEVETALLSARALLTRAGAPAGGRWLAVSPEFATPLFALDKFSRVDASGSASALRDAVLGRVYGMNVVESAGLTGELASESLPEQYLVIGRKPAK